MASALVYCADQQYDERGFLGLAVSISGGIYQVTWYSQTSALI